MTYFRRRLAHPPDPNRIFETVRAVIEQTGILTGRTWQAPDSTVLLDAVATPWRNTGLKTWIRKPTARDILGQARSDLVGDDRT